MTGAELIAKSLAANAIARVFTVPGLHLLTLLDALVAQGIPVELAADERGAAFMADGQSRSGGGLGMVLLIPGPGLTNALTGLAEARADGVPLVALVLEDDLVHGLGPMHELDQARLLEPVAKHVLRPSRIEDLAQTLTTAIQLAQAGCPGPVAVLLPVSHMEQGRSSIPTCADRLPDPVSVPGIAPVVQALISARQVGIYAGAGCAAASTALIRLAECLGAPVATTISGRGVIPEDHPLAVGVGFGPGSAPWARKAFQSCDLLLALGCRFSAAATAGWSWQLPERRIHLDIESAHLQPGSEGLALAADLTATLPALVRAMPGPYDRSTRAITAIPAWRDTDLRRTLARSPDAEHVTPARLLRCLRARLPRDAVAVCDSGNHLLWALQEFPIFTERSFLAPADYQSMGYGLPAAIGAALSHPHRRVVAIIGDGGLLMAAGELATLSRLRLPLVVLVFNDGALGLIRAAQSQAGRFRCATRLATPDLGLLAQAHGLTGVRIASDHEIESGLTQAMAATGPVLVDVAVDYRQPTRLAKAIALAQWRSRPLPERLRLLVRWLGNRITPPVEV